MFSISINHKQGNWNYNNYNIIGMRNIIDFIVKDFHEKIIVCTYKDNYQNDMESL